MFFFVLFFRHHPPMRFEEDVVPDQLKMIFADHQLHRQNQNTLVSFQVQKHSTIHLFLNEMRQNGITLFVNMTYGNALVLDVQFTDTMEIVKEKILEKTGTKTVTIHKTQLQLHKHVLISYVLNMFLCMCMIHDRKGARGAAASLQ